MNDRQGQLFAAIRRGDRAAVQAMVQAHPECVHARDQAGATPLHYAAEIGDREMVRALLEGGADVNARDARFGATPAGWAIEYLRERGALLGMEIEDVAEAIARGDAPFVERCMARLPALRDAADHSGTRLRDHAARSGNAAIAKLFGAER
jgi:ankyrin repeat protein